MQTHIHTAQLGLVGTIIELWSTTTMKPVPRLRHTQISREKQTHEDSIRYRQTDIQTHTQGKLTDPYSQRHTDLQRQRHTHTHTQKLSNTHTDTQTERDPEGHTDD